VDLFVYTPKPAEGAYSVLYLKYYRQARISMKQAELLDY